jgi:hypothetical protein
MQRVSLLLGFDPLAAISSDIAERESGSGSSRLRAFGVTRTFFVGRIASLPLACAPSSRRRHGARERSRG